MRGLNNLFVILPGKMFFSNCSRILTNVLLLSKLFLFETYFLNVLKPSYFPASCLEKWGFSKVLK